MRARQAIDVTMLVPGLLGPGGAGSRDPDAARVLVDGLDLRALDRLLERAEGMLETTPDDSIEALAFRALGYEARPVAAGGVDVPDATATTRSPAADGPDAGTTVRHVGAGGPDRGTTDWPLAAGGRVDGSAIRPASGTDTSATDDIPRLHTADWPVAAITALVDCGAGGDAPWLRADPVHLRPDIADLVLFDAEDAGISSDEARALAETVNEAFRPGGPFVDAAHPHRWYVALEAPARMTTTPPSLAAGARVSAAMPYGPDAPRWRRWMNEVQMALHECPTNVERERRGAAPVNSVWLWGGGRLPPAPGGPVPFVQARSDDALVHGLARRAGIECGALPTDAGAWLGCAPQPGGHLIAFDGLYRAVRRSDIDTWRTGLADFSASWAKPLLDAVDRGAVARVSLHDERGHRFVATRWGRFRWWRRRRGRLAARIAGAARRG